MQPAAARVGPSNEPSVRRIAVRFSSGATICIEKTIKVLFFRVVVSTMDNADSASSSQEARQPAMRMAAAGKSPSKQRARKSSRQNDCALRRPHPPKIRRRLRNLGVHQKVRITRLRLSNFLRG